LPPLCNLASASIPFLRYIIGFSFYSDEDEENAHQPSHMNLGVGEGG
jgi:hypothetical protein